MRGLPEGMRLKLLEANPTPSLAEMENFAKRFRAIRQADIPTLTFAVKPAAGVDDDKMMASTFRPRLHDAGTTPVRYDTGVKRCRCVMFYVPFTRCRCDIGSVMKDNSYDITQ